MADINIGGRPTKYKPEYCKKIIKFFSIDPSYTTTETVTGKNWEKETTKQIPNQFPTLEKFAHSINVNGDTLVEWSKDDEKYSGFPAAYKKAKELQKNFLIQNGLLGLYPAAAFCFVAKNVTDMRDKTEVEHTGLPEPPKELTVRIAKD
jgi:hypothetical protein